MKIEVKRNMKRNGEERKWKMEKQRSKENEPIHTETKKTNLFEIRMR